VKLPLNGGEIFDSGNPEHIPLGFSLFINRYDKPSFLLGHFLVKFKNAGISLPKGKK
jgi:hypothetical protein